MLQQPQLPQRFRLQVKDIHSILPRVPETIEDTGISTALIEDLILRRLFQAGRTSGLDLAHLLGLPYNGVVETIIGRLIDDKKVEYTGGPGFGRPYFDYHLTDKGRDRAHEAFERSRYVGPAPVPLSAYTSMIHKQMRDIVRVDRAELAAAFGDLVLEHAFIERLGPAVNSVRSLFLYGAPGNGKTSIAERIARVLRGEVFVPYALEVDGQIIQIFDPLVHRPLVPISTPPGALPLQSDDEDLSPPTQLHMSVFPDDTDELEVEEDRTVEARIPQSFSRTHQLAEPGAAVSDSPPPSEAQSRDTMTRIVDVPPFDGRWVLTYRPRIIVGGELTLENLDLIYNPSRFYEAPYQVKASSGMLLIDDFGRQKVHPTDLLNRWIVPLEKRVDYLTLETGKKFEIPFDLLIIFSTNIDPSKLVDEAFLRRIRYKIEVADPTEQAFRNIFKREAKRQGIEFSQGILEYLMQKYYRRTGRPFRACHPRDILQLVADQAKFLGVKPSMTKKLIAQACESYFVHMEGSRSHDPEDDIDIESLLSL